MKEMSTGPNKFKDMRKETNQHISVQSHIEKQNLLKYMGNDWLSRI